MKTYSHANKDVLNDERENGDIIVNHNLSKCKAFKSTDNHIGDDMDQLIPEESSDISESPMLPKFSSSKY
jgi:hypothetical protein